MSSPDRAGRAPRSPDAPTPPFDLLANAVVPVRRGAETVAHSLPGIYRLLGADAVDEFPGLAAHQAQAWYQFLVQAGAVAISRSEGDAALSDSVVRRRVEGLSESDWRALFEELTPDRASTAWSLVAEDPSAPAFLQPPTTRLEAYRPFAPTPDALDILVTAKNHDRKRARASRAGAHQWLYSLVTLQTTQGYSGRGQPGVARMNGGLSSRILVDRRPNHRWGPRVVRGIRMLLARRREVLEQMDEGVFRGRGGLALSWLRSWDSDDSLPVAELDPYFIEICRRIRLVAGPDGEIRALARPAMSPRVNAKSLKGRLGDPWIPIKSEGDGAGEARTVSAGGFDYRLAQRLLLREKPLALRPLEDEKGADSEIHLAVLVRGQGKTEGLHERLIPLPGTIDLGGDLDDDEDTTLADLAQEMVEVAAAVRKVLRQAVIVYLQGPDKPDFRRKDAAPIVTAYDRRVDEKFFDHLFQSPNSGPEGARRGWQGFLRQAAEELMRRAWSRSSPPAARREKARASSSFALYKGLRRSLPEAFPEAHTDVTQEESG